MHLSIQIKTFWGHSGGDKQKIIYSEYSLISSILIRIIITTFMF